MVKNQLLFSYGYNAYIFSEQAMHIEPDSLWA